ncbi:hypothetical protein TNCV_4482911 [Trichonephila clavipes]|nr:hypothetical protein TNCV_4482911 [Trichonephila clavipes]
MKKTFLVRKDDDLFNKFGGVSELILTSHCSATRGLLATDHVILNHGPFGTPFSATTPHQQGFSSTDLTCIAWRVFSGTGIELMTCLPWLDTLTTGLPQPYKFGGRSLPGIFRLGRVSFIFGDFIACTGDTEKYHNYL